MSRPLANQLLGAPSAAAFFKQRGGRLAWPSFAALKREIDRLVHRDLNEAARLADRIAELAALTEDARNTAFAESGRARVLHLQGRYGEANRLYETAIQSLAAAGLRTEAAIARKQQVDALTHLGRFDEALKAARSARHVLAASEPLHHAQLEANVGNIYYLLDRYKPALAHYDRAHQMLEAVGDARMRAIVDGNRANIFTELDRPDEAAALLTSAARTFDRAGQTVAALQCRMHAAYLSFLRGNYNTALRGYYEARERLDQLGSVNHLAWCDLEVAEILLALNAFDDAAESAAQASAKFTELLMPYEAARAHMTGALAATGLGRFEQAAGDLLTARAAFAASSNATFTALADTYLAALALRRHDAGEAARRADSARRTFAGQKLATRAAYARLLAARAAHQAGDQARAKRLAQAAIAAVKDRFAPSVVYAGLHLIGKIERARGQRRPALSHFRQAVAVIEQMRGGITADEFRASFLRDKIEVYEDATAACLDEGGGARCEEAFRLVESSKSRALADLLSRYLRETPETGSQSRMGGVDDKQRARLLKLIEELNWYSAHARLEDERGEQRRAGASLRYAREVARCEREVTALFKRIETGDSQFGEMQRMPAVSLDELQSTLAPDETAIEYFTLGDELSAFVVSRKRVEVVRAIASKRELDQQLAALRFQLEKFNYGTRFADEHFEQLSNAANFHLALIHRAVFAGLEKHIGGEQLIIVPHGALHYIPFHALLNRRGYLADQFEISYAPSATVLHLCRARKRPPVPGPSRGSTLSLPDEVGRADGALADGKLMAFGVARRETPSIAAEIRALKQLFPDSLVFTGRQATRENLLKFAPAARYLHLASHGHFRRDNPMFSFLRLADAPLNFYSLMDLRLNAEMVTLSACHTGVNQVFPGDELHGLMRGFLYAGAPSLVASLWAVNDASTTDFIKTMYKEIRNGATKRAALRSAQLAVKDAYGHPYYWAPFFLMGNPN